MKYPLLPMLDELLAQKLISKRPHPTLPLFIYNYSASAQGVARSEWPDALNDCRGLILDHEGNIVGRPFRKFWNYEQVLAEIPTDEAFTVWEKLDGSLGIVCNFNGQRVVSSRGSFESDQAAWAASHLAAERPAFLPAPGLTYLFEILYPANRIVVDYGQRSELVLLAVMDQTAIDRDDAFESETRFTKARRFDGIADFSIVNADPRFANDEGFVVRWASGLRAKVKAEEYKRLHRLITQCSTRTIWELLRSGKGTQELVDRVPEDFQQWVRDQVAELHREFEAASLPAITTFNATPRRFESRKDFALWAKDQPNPGLLFALLDGKSIEDMVWKLVEPKWAVPFRKDAE